MWYGKPSSCNNYNWLLGSPYPHRTRFMIRKYATSRIGERRDYIVLYIYMYGDTVKTCTALKVIIAVRFAKTVQVRRRGTCPKKLDVFYAFSLSSRMPENTFIDVPNGVTIYDLILKRTNKPNDKYCSIIKSTVAFCRNCPSAKMIFGRLVYTVQIFIGTNLPEKIPDE